MARIIFLGTAGDSLAHTKWRRRAGGILLQIAGGQYHLDPGPGAVEAMAHAGISSRETICVLATNNTLLASEGVNEVIDAMTLGGVDKSGILICSPAVANGTETERSILRKAFAPFVERIITFEDTTRISVNDLTITPKKSLSRDPTAFGLVLDSGSLTIGYPGDTEYFDGLAEQYQGVDVFILKLKHLKGANEKDSINVAEAEELLRKVKPRVCFITGFGSRLLDEDPLAVARHLQTETRIEVIAAKDGLEQELDQFAQETLRLFENQ